jgi:pimeloyl-ACP methyl ester carboxylesterase
MSVKLILPGQARVAAGEKPYENVPNVTILAEAEVTGTLRTVAEPAVVEVADADEEHIVAEIDIGDGVKRWTALSQMLEDGTAKRKQSRVFGGVDVIEISPLAAEDASRGIFTWVFKGLKILRVDPAATAAKAALTVVLNKFEGKLETGLHRLDRSGSFAGAFDGGGAGAPYLLFLHGTASSTSGSFGKMFDKAEFQKLWDNHQGRVLALEHKSLSVSPIQNAVAAVTALPEGATLRLVSHSRGGLVGELLCLGDFHDSALEPFVSSKLPAHQGQAAELRQLRQLLRAKRLVIDKFVRVACPARGTVLAGKRLDIWASVILNAISKITVIEGPITDFLKETLLTLIKLRTKPEELPGLEAMMPGSPLVRFLRTHSSAADLAVISGDLEGSGFWKTLAVLATDAFYLQDHDLVVNTRAMYGGMRRERGSYYFFDKGAEVNHFSYFVNESTRKRLAAWMAGDKTGFTKFETSEERDYEASSRAQEEDRDKPLLIFIPGELGSALSNDAGRVWPDVTGLLRDGLHVLDPSVPLKAEIARECYGPLLASLASRYRVEEFAWDWRQGIGDAANALLAFIKNQQAPQIRFVTVSGGGLVVRAMAARDPKLWTDLVQKKKARVVMLGAPNRGTYWAAELVSGVAPLSEMLALIGNVTPKEAGARLAKCQSIVDLLPDALLPVDSAYAGRWNAIDVTLDDARLQAAANLRREIEYTFAGSQIYQIVGKTDETPGGLKMADGKLSIDWSAYGDGRVTYTSAAPRDIPAWRADVPHGSLIAYPPVHQAIVDILETGSTRALAQDIPAIVANTRSRAIERAQILFPEDEDLIAEVIGPRTDVAGQPMTSLRVSVTNGNVNAARHLVMVGHYLGDSIVNAEAVLDRLLDGALSRRFHLRIYPAAEGSNAVVFSGKKDGLKGAIVVGLGEVGKLTGEKLRRGVTDAALRYATSVLEMPHDGGKPPKSLAISSLLLGSNGGTSLDLEGSACAVVLGIIDANRALAAREVDLRFQDLEFIELYEVRAVAAANVLNAVKERIAPDLLASEALLIDSQLRTTDFIRFDAPASEYVGGWWRRVRVAQEAACECKGREGERELHFTVLTDRARAEKTIHAGSEDFVSSLVESAIKDQQFDQKTASALYELLIPNVVKDAAGDETDVVLIVDEHAAQYPWELCVDRFRGGITPGNQRNAKPLSTEIGLIRQLESVKFRVQPRTPSDNVAFVVGDTSVAGAPLKGAEREAREVAATLTAAGYDVKPFYCVSPHEFVRELYAHDYRILHIAAHGKYDRDDPRKSGIMLSLDRTLSSYQLEQLRVVPEFVFLNCCHIGQIQPGDVSRVAASTARALIEMGVGAVIAAGWAVDDQAAVTFANTFYKEFLAPGGTFGAAVKAARKATWQKHGHTNTWGAYQCYGNPAFALNHKTPPPQARTAKFCSRREYFTSFRCINADIQAGGGTEEHRDVLKVRLKQLRESLPAEWADGEMLAAYGAALAELGDYAAAIEALDEALRAETATMPIRAVEQLANFLSRHAATQNPDEAEKLLTRANELLNWLTTWGKTSERLSLYAAMWKRRAIIAKTAAARTKALQKAGDYYKEASQHAIDVERQFSPYAALGYLLMHGLANPSARPGLLVELDGWTSAIELAAANTLDVWGRLYPLDARLTRAVLKDQAAQTTDLPELYSNVVKHHGTERTRETLKEHFLLVNKALRDSKQHPLAKAVERIRKAVMPA